VIAQTVPWNAKAAKAAKKILSSFASFATSAFDRDVLFNVSTLRTSLELAL